jgi:biotin operon repressor
MKLFSYAERINFMNRLIQQGKTGSPEEFANRIGLSRTRIYEIIDDLKLEGAPIMYSKSRRSFYYEEPFDISVQITLKSIDKNEEKLYNGGYFIQMRTFFPDVQVLFSYCNVTSC